jgi:DNA-binding PadR family transcriptional regulator
LNAALLRILSALAEGEGSSADLLARLRRPPAVEAPSLATFYRRLKEAVDNGWIEAVPGAGGDAGPGRPAQVFRLSDAGRAAAREEAARWREVSERVLGGQEPAR